MQDPKRVYTATETLIVWCLSLAATAWLNLDFLHMPPIWDAAPGVFAPAVYLYESGFDWEGLLAQPGYMAGGPNVHSLSLIALLTATGLWLAGGDVATALPWLHSAQFAFTATALTGTYLMARLSQGRAISALTAVAVLFLPAFRVQSGFLYTEILGAGLVVLALYAWARSRTGWAIAAIVLASANKSLALPFAGALAVLILLDRRSSVGARLLNLSALSFLVAALEYVKWLFLPTDIANVEERLSNLHTLWDRLLTVPDLLLLITIALAWTPYRLRTLCQRDRRLLPAIAGMTAADDSERAAVGLATFVTAFIAFVVFATQQQLRAFIPLTRYYVWIAPLLMLIFVDMARHIGYAIGLPERIPFGARAVTVLMGASLALWIAVSAINRHGVLYPELGGLKKFSVVERSLEYLQYYESQRHGVRSVVRCAEDLPVFVARGEYYFLSSPLMGYVPTTGKDVRLILRPPYDGGDISAFPADFMVLDSSTNAFHGGRAIVEVLRAARRDARYAVSLVDAHASGAYRSRLYRIRAVDGQASTPSRDASACNAAP